MENLTRKQNKFVDELLASGVPTRAAIIAYPNATYDSQRQIAHENMTKPYILDAIAERSKKREELVQKAHDSLLTAVRLDYFVFPRKMEDDEIVKHVEAQGLTVLNIRPSDKGKLAFFSLPDGASRAKGIEIHHKVEGSFAPEKKIIANIEVEASPRLQALAKKLYAGQRGIHARGIDSSIEPAADSVGGAERDTE